MSGDGYAGWRFGPILVEREILHQEGKKGGPGIKRKLHIRERGGGGGVKERCLLEKQAGAILLRLMAMAVKGKRIPRYKRDPGLCLLPVSKSSFFQDFIIPLNLHVMSFFWSTWYRTSNRVHTAEDPTIVRGPVSYSRFPFSIKHRNAIGAHILSIKYYRHGIINLITAIQNLSYRSPPQPCLVWPNQDCFNGSLGSSSMYVLVSFATR